MQYCLTVDQFLLVSCVNACWIMEKVTPCLHVLPEATSL